MQSMLKTGIKIVNGLVLIITMAALIGINVSQLHCCHSDYTFWKVQMLPDVIDSEVDGELCGESDCEPNTRHNFYKLTDLSKIESDFGFDFIFFCQPVQRGNLSCLFVQQRRYFVVTSGLSDPAMGLELLCTYLC